MASWFKAGSSRGSPPVVAPGDTVELQVYDDAGNEQGTILLGILEDLGRHKDGKVVAAMFLGASDLYYHWWMNEGPNAPNKDRGIYHLCMVSSGACPPLKKYPNMIHGDRYRNLGEEPLTSKRVPWLKDKSIKEGYDFCVKKFRGVMGDPPATGPAPTGIMKKPRAAWADKSDPSHEGESDDEGSSEGKEESSSDDEAMAAKISKLRKELKKAEEDAAEGKKKKKAMKKARHEGGTSHRGRAREKEDDPGEPGEKKKKKKKTTGEKEKKERKKRKEEASVKEKKAKRKRRDESSGSAGAPASSKPHKKRRAADESDGESDRSDESGRELFGVKRKEKEILKSGEGDRGPFGGGAPVKFSDKEEGSSDSGKTGEPDVAQDGAGGSQGHGGAGKERRKKDPSSGVEPHLDSAVAESGHESGTPIDKRVEDSWNHPGPVSKRVPIQGGRHGHPTDKGRGEGDPRGSLGAAQHLELLAPENSMLIEKDEEMYVAREYLLEQKLKHYDRPGPRREGDGKGKSKGAKGKTKDKEKGDRPGWDKTEKGQKKPDSK
eukprot:s1173_g3.t1